MQKTHVHGVHRLHTSGLTITLTANSSCGRYTQSTQTQNPGSATFLQGCLRQLGAGFRDLRILLRFPGCFTCSVALLPSSAALLATAAAKSPWLETARDLSFVIGVFGLIRLRIVGSRTFNLSGGLCDTGFNRNSHVSSRSLGWTKDMFTF